MDRRDFIRSCAVVCLGCVGVSTLIPSCTSSQILSGSISGDDLVVDIKNFQARGGKEMHYKKYLVVQHQLLQYPICIYRVNESQYNALWMRCTHQGTELQVFGDKLQCPAHGSEFNNNGTVNSGPAEATLRTFPVTISNDQLKISLKAV